MPSDARGNGSDVQKDTGVADVKTVVVQEDTNLTYGFGSCGPSWLKWCLNPKALLFWLSWFALIQGFVVNGINNVNTSTIERRYKLPSAQVGLISSAYDLSAGILILPLSYIGAYGHQPRMLAVGALVMSLGSFIMMLPQFTVPPYELGSRVEYGCTNSTTACNTTSSGLSNYLYMFMSGQALHGVGGTMLYSLGLVVIDNNVPDKNGPLYQGVFYSCSILGPALGYVLGGQLLTIYVDFYKVRSGDIGITPGDPRWVGAWWIGFAVSAVLAVTIFLGLIPYPRELPVSRSVRKNRKNQTHQTTDTTAAEKEDFGKSLKDLPKSLKILLCNPVNMCVTVSGILDGIVISGFATFMPKYIQTQFGLTAAAAAAVGGLLTVPGGAGGQIIGGLIPKLLKLKVRGLLRMCIILPLICTSFIIGMSFISCDSPKIAGVNVRYDNSSIEIDAKAGNLVSSCNSYCGCTAASYRPFCGVNRVQYFSPCHAGCNTLTRQGYGNCSCVDSYVGGNTSIIHGVPGTCAPSCDRLNIFIPVFFFVILTTFIPQVPAAIITLRTVPDSQRAFGIGLKWVFVRFLGTVPGPIIYGAVFDLACEVWQDTCGRRGSCWIYNKQKMIVYGGIISVSVKLLSSTFFGLAYLCYRPPPEDDKKPLEMTMPENEADANTGQGSRPHDNGGIVNNAYSEPFEYKALFSESTSL